MEEIDALRDGARKAGAPDGGLVGGAKVSTKIPVLTHLVAKVDKLIIGGGMANTFLQATGVMVGKSLAEPEFSATARDIMTEAKRKAARSSAGRRGHRARVQGRGGERSRRH